MNYNEKCHVFFFKLIYANCWLVKQNHNVSNDKKLIFLLIFVVKYDLGMFLFL